MKRLFAALFAIIIGCAAICGSAENAEESEEIWYEITNGAVLTVWLPGNTADGMSWDFEISSPMHFELLTHEVLEEAGGEGEGVPTTYAASFAGFSGEEANVSIIFSYTGEGMEVPRSTRVLEMKLDEGNGITLLSVLKRDQTADWIEYNEEMEILTVRLPDDGDEWNITQTATGALELITCEETEGCFVASYFAAGEWTGDAEISFASGTDEIYTIRMDIGEQGEMLIKYAEEFFICE